MQEAACLRQQIHFRFWQKPFGINLSQRHQAILFANRYRKPCHTLMIKAQKNRKTIMRHHLGKCAAMDQGLLTTQTDNPRLRAGLHGSKRRIVSTQMGRTVNWRVHKRQKPKWRLVQNCIHHEFLLHNFTPGYEAIFEA
jgi:hypothetical protein